MSADKKAAPADPWSIHANIGLILISGLLLYFFSLWLWRNLQGLWASHGWVCVALGIAILGTLAAWFATWLWNWKSDQEYERGITGPDKNAVRLGSDDKGRPIYLKQRFRTMHAQVIGTTSAGKTESVILPWAIHDIENGNGLLIVDGKSDTSFLDKLYAYAHRANRAQDFRLFSLAHIESSHTFNPMVGGGATEIVERVFSSFRFENEFYRNIQYRIFHLLVRLILAKKVTPTFMLVHRLITDPDLLTVWARDCGDELLRQELLKFVQENPKTREEKTSGLVTHLGHFSGGEFGTLFNSVNPGIQFSEALEKNHICYFQLPSMYLPFLSEATGKLVLQAFQSAVSKRHLARDGKEQRFFSCFLDDFQDYIYEGFGALLNKSRSANIGVVFSHQAIGDLNKVSPAFTNVVLTNTNIKCVMRTSDPDTADHFARSFGTEKSEKTTERRKESIFGATKTGDGSVREVDQYVIHPNEIRSQGTGRGIVTVPHPRGVKIIRTAFERREDLPALSLPEVKKTLPTIDDMLSSPRKASDSTPHEPVATTVVL